MECFSGKSVFEGIAIGKIVLTGKWEQEVKLSYAEDAKEQIIRFEQARMIAKEQLEKICHVALQRAGKEQAEIFRVHLMLLDDMEFLEMVQHLIKQHGWDAAYAVHVAGKRQAAVFQVMDDIYMKERAADILDVSDRLVRVLSGQTQQTFQITEPVIVAADDLTPSETIMLDKQMILGLVIRKGSAASHTAILARAMNIPTLVQTDFPLSAVCKDMTAIVDGYSGMLYLEPDSDTMKKLENRKLLQERDRAELRKLVGKKAITADGRSIALYANIGSLTELESALLADAEGIGLLRSEFLYLGRKVAPAEEEQYEIYKEILNRMNGRKVIIRTLDIGADKQETYFEMPKEINPAMGYRGIRVSLDRKNLFRTQLRAILRAAVFGQAAVMFPMIISVQEIRQIKEIMNEVQQELARAQIPYGKVELGIMIETPAAALISDQLAGEVSFFSIGTNDLIQYTLAVDRESQSVSGLYDAHHPAVLRLIQMTVENAHKAGIPVGICGEMAADTDMTEVFLNMGVDELSVAPTSLMQLRKTIRAL